MTDNTVGEVHRIKSSPNDTSGVDVSITVDNGTLTVSFDKPIQHLSFSSEDTMIMIASLLAGGSQAFGSHENEPVIVH